MIGNPLHNAGPRPVFLFHRRLLWWPTLRGGLLLLVGTLGLLWWIAHQANGFFALNQPAVGADGQPARLLVVEGWMSEDDLRQVIAAVPAERYAHIVTSGGPIQSWSSFASHADRAADYLGRQGLKAQAVPAPPARTERTYGAALAVRDWARREGIEVSAVDIFSPGVHARRSRLLFGMAFGAQVGVGVFSTRPSEFDAARWWTSSEGTKALLNETLSLGWTVCCFWPSQPGPGAGSSGP